MNTTMERIKKRPQELTRAELEIMQILWRKGRALVHDILDGMPRPHPAYNTVSTIVRILEQKGFVGHTAYGRTHEYHPLVDREEYTEHYMNGVLGNFFGGSLVQMMSFFTSRDNISIKDYDKIIGILEQVNRRQAEDNQARLDCRNTNRGMKQERRQLADSALQGRGNQGITSEDNERGEVKGGGK